MGKTAQKKKPVPINMVDARDKISTYLRLRAEIKEREDELATLKDELLDTSIRAGGKLQTAVGSISVVEQERKTISADALLLNGVRQQIIEKCTVTTAVTFVKVTPPKADE